MTIIASFTVAADSADAIATCLGAMCGVSALLDGTALTVEVRPPFGSERMDQARGTILSIDPSAVEVV